ncbi:DUF2079 domain-containing protein [Microbispora siamensis]|uniref:DUF2079 domain-containing protein n=1 Tax=Microbispora siamensis TaxID=564413 RepID=A0ABQ4GLD0_9ACTN|nr:DUF2079 domain-containing protein [Microbispora siamensis]GIH62224.1 hypothetical protein Msi02_30410 [Microbispora siamensis]
MIEMRRIWPLACLIPAAAAYAILGLVKYARFRTGIYDLVIFDQAVRGYSRFGAPGSFVKDQWNQIGTAVTILGDHFSPILAVLAPLYWIYDGPQTLIVAQAVLFAVAAIPLWRLSRRRLGTPAAYLVAAAYLLSWPIAEAAAFHFHEYAFVPLLTAVLFERLDAGRRGAVIVSAAALLLVKEDLGFFVAGLGLALLFRPSWRLIGAAMVVLGPVAVWVTSQIIIPAFGGSSGRYWYYSGLGSHPGEVVTRFFTRPLDVLSVLTSPGVKVQTMLLLLALVLFVPLLSPYALPPTMLILERMLATDQPGWWGTSYHYNSAVVMALFCASIDAIDRFQQRRGTAEVSRWRLGLTWATACAVLSLGLVAAFPLRDVFDPAWYRSGAREDAAAAAVAVVPDGVLVEAANQVGPNLSARTKVVMWRPMPRRAPWIVADVASRQPIFKSVEEQRADVAELQARGYRLVMEREGYVVLHLQGGEAAGAGTRRRFGC